MIWVGTANHPDPTTSSGLALQDRAAKAAAAERPGVVFIDTWDLLAGRDGGWAAYVIDPRDGTGKAVRMADGFHPNEAGSELLAPRRLVARARPPSPSEVLAHPRVSGPDECSTPSGDAKPSDQVSGGWPGPWSRGGDCGRR